MNGFTVKWPKISEITTVSVAGRLWHTAQNPKQVFSETVAMSAYWLTPRRYITEVCTYRSSGQGPVYQKVHRNKFWRF